MKSKSSRDPGGPADPIGGAFLVREYGLELVQPLPVQSEVGSRRRTIHEGGHRREVYQEPVRPGPGLAAHLTFMLKHEGVHLEMLARLFERMNPEVLASWVRAEPTGRYARRAGFLYEWLTRNQLP